MLLTLGEQVPQHLSSNRSTNCQNAAVPTYIQINTWCILVAGAAIQTDMPFLCTPPWYVTVSQCRLRRFQLSSALWKQSINNKYIFSQIRTFMKWKEVLNYSSSVHQLNKQN